MKILIIGDIYGGIGRDATKMWIPKIKELVKIDFIIANCENVTHGKSIIRSHYDELKNAGVNVFTSGNHIFGNKAVFDFIDIVPDLLRPLNYNPYHPGKGTGIYEVNNKRLRITNIIGRTFMDKAENPYHALDELLKLEAQDPEQHSDIHIIDIHAEATGEKVSFAWYLDGKVSAVVGTHTHVQTVDNRLLPQGTAFISDIGFSGAHYSIIGANPLQVIYRDRTSLPAKFEPATGIGQFSAVIITIDDETNKAQAIERIFISPDHQDLKIIK